MHVQHLFTPCTWKPDCSCSSLRQKSHIGTPTSRKKPLGWSLELLIKTSGISVHLSGPTTIKALNKIQVVTDMTTVVALGFTDTHNSFANKRPMKESLDFQEEWSDEDKSTRMLLAATLLFSLSLPLTQPRTMSEMGQWGRPCKIHLARTFLSLAKKRRKKTTSATPLGKSVLHVFRWSEDWKACNLKKRPTRLQYFSWRCMELTCWAPPLPHI